MLGDSGVGTIVAYVFIYAFWLLVLVVFLRFAVMVSLLWIAPLAPIFRRIPLLRRWVPPDAGQGEPHRD